MAVFPTLEEGEDEGKWWHKQEIVEKEADYKNKCDCDLLAPMTRSL